MSEKQIQLKRALTHSANLYLDSLKKSFPDYYRGSHFYTEDDCFERLNENVTEDFLNHLCKREKPYIFGRDNGISRLLGKPDFYKDMDREERVAWWTSLENMLKFFTIVRSAGDRVSLFEDMALACRAAGTTAVEQKMHPFAAVTNLLKNSEMRTKMSDGFKDTTSIKQMLGSVGPLLATMTNPPYDPDQDCDEWELLPDEVVQEVKEQGKEEVQDKVEIKQEVTQKPEKRAYVEEEACEDDLPRPPSEMFRSLNLGGDKSNVADQVSGLIKDMLPKVNLEESCKMFHEALSGKGDNPLLEQASNFLTNGDTSGLMKMMMSDPNIRGSKSTLDKVTLLQKQLAKMNVKQNMQQLLPSLVQTTSPEVQSTSSAPASPEVQSTSSAPASVAPEVQSTSSAPEVQSTSSEVQSTSSAPVDGGEVEREVEATEMGQDIEQVD